MILCCPTVMIVKASWCGVHRILQFKDSKLSEKKKENYLIALDSSRSNVCFAGILKVLTARRNLTDVE